MRVMQFKYRGPKIAGGPQKGFILTVKVTSSTYRPTIQEIKQALLDAGFPSGVAANSTVNGPSYWE